MTLEDSSLVVLIAGGHASGKESGAIILKDELSRKFKDDELNINLIDMQDYMTPIEGQHGSRLPSQFDFIKLQTDLEIAVSSDVYDVIIVFGLYALYDKKIVSMATISLYIDCDPDVRLGRWIKKDILIDESNDNPNKEEEMEKLEQLLNTYLNYSRNEMSKYIQDTKERADVILPKGADIVGFILIVDGLQSSLLKRLRKNSSRKSSISSSTMTISDTNRSYSVSSLNREAVIQSIKILTNEPSVMSLNKDNFSNKNKIFYSAD